MKEKKPSLKEMKKALGIEPKDMAMIRMLAIATAMIDEKIKRIHIYLALIALSAAFALLKIINIL